MKPIDALIVPTARKAAVGYATQLADILRVDMLIIRNRSIADARNKGLQAAETCGWRHVMFLDDDMRVHPEQVVDAAFVLKDTQVAVFTAHVFPDNSVMRHAQRLSGVNVPVFPSGGAMLVNMNAVPRGRMFPEIYNEDWFYMHGLEVVPVGDVNQVPYNPFVPGRAAREEFGDLIAEAIKDREVTVDPCFWDAKIVERESFLNGLNVEGAAALSVAEARETLSSITVKQVTDFIRSWQDS